MISYALLSFLTVDLTSKRRGKLLKSKPASSVNLVELMRRENLRTIVTTSMKTLLARSLSLTETQLEMQVRSWFMHGLISTIYLSISAFYCKFDLWVRTWSMNFSALPHSSLLMASLKSKMPNFWIAACKSSTSFSFGHADRKLSRPSNESSWISPRSILSKRSGPI